MKQVKEINNLQKNPLDSKVTTVQKSNLNYLNVVHFLACLKIFFFWNNTESLKKTAILILKLQEVILQIVTYIHFCEGYLREFSSYKDVKKRNYPVFLDKTLLSDLCHNLQCTVFWSDNGSCFEKTTDHSSKWLHV